jgi:hypothetical protein
LLLVVVKVRGVALSFICAEGQVGEGAQVRLDLHQLSAAAACKKLFKKERALLVFNILFPFSLSRRILSLKQGIKPLHARPDLVG